MSYITKVIKLDRELGYVQVCATSSDKRTLPSYYDVFGQKDGTFVCRESWVRKRRIAKRCFELNRVLSDAARDAMKPHWVDDRPQCSACDGAGRTGYDKFCRYCDGTGKVKQ